MPRGEFKMKLKLDDIKVCYPTAILPPQDEGKSNIFLGVGLWSKTHGLTAGIPIDILSMIITADKLRKQIDPLRSKIYLFIADNFALESRSNHPEISEKAILEQRDKTIQVINELCQLLKIENVVIEDSRILKDCDLYQEIAQEAAQKHHALFAGKELEKTTENYVIKQTALIGYYSAKKNCALKISWCFDPHKIGTHSKLIIEQGIATKSYDELWFDAYYQLYLGERYPIGFVYTPPGVALNSAAKNTCAPYFAKNQLEFPRVLFGDSIESLIGNEKAGKIPVKLSHGRSQKKGNAKVETYFQFMLVILNELKETYGDCIPISSKKEEYKEITIIEDLAKIANFSAFLEQKKQLFCGNEIKEMNYKRTNFPFFFEGANETCSKNHLVDNQLARCPIQS
jgi:hypothetical protein